VVDPDADRDAVAALPVLGGAVRGLEVAVTVQPDPAGPPC
jgi:hypothetical protein